MIPSDAELARWLFEESNQVRIVLFPLFAKDDPVMIEKILDLSPLFGLPLVNYSELRRLDRQQRRLQFVSAIYFVSLALIFLFALGRMG